jgi:hypothetical protein
LNSASTPTLLSPRSILPIEMGCRPAVGQLLLGQVARLAEAAHLAAQGRQVRIVLRGDGRVDWPYQLPTILFLETKGIGSW